MPLFSIIIPTFNSQSTIKDCISSILQQSYSDYEVLIIDGLSSDKTLDIIYSFKDWRIKIISEQDSGIYDAMNKGIKHSEGKWLYFLGSDDSLYDKDVLQKIAIEVKNKDVDFVYGNAFFISRNNIYDGEFTREKLINKKNICHQAIFYKKTIFDRLGMYNTRFYINADWDFNLRCFATPDIKIKFIPLTIVKYNDLTGLSSTGENRDTEFHKISNARLNHRIEELENYIKELENSKMAIYSTKEYRLGNLILKPLKKIKYFFQ